MSAARRFTVLTTGEIEPGFDETQVVMDFVSLVNTTPERAVAFIHTEQQMIADVDEERALAYQKKLSNIGMKIRIVDSEELMAANETDSQDGAFPLDSRELNLDPDSANSNDDSNASNAYKKSASTQHPAPAQSAILDNQSHEADIIENIREAGFSLDEDLSKKPSIFSFSNRSLRLGILAIISLVLVAFIHVTRTVKKESNAARFSVTNTASTDMNRLMEVSGLKAESSRF